LPKTVEQIRSNVLEYGFSSQNYASRIDRWIDEAQRYMFRRAGLRNKETTSKFSTEAGKSEYSLPANFSSVKSLFNDTVAPNLNMEVIQDIKEYDALESEEGEPTSYLIHNNSILLYPTPNAVNEMVLRYNIVPTAIAEESSANPEIAEEFYNLIEEYCLYKAYAAEGDIEMSNFHKGNFDREMVNFVGEVNTDTHDGNTQIVGGMDTYFNW
jgi:hypothetical protein